MEIVKAELLHSLEMVQPAIADKEILEQSTSFAFNEDTVLAFNNEIQISHPIPNLNFTGAIKAKELHSILQKIPNDIIQLKKEKNQIVLSADKIKIGLFLQSKIKLPEIQRIKKWSSIPKDFIEGLNFCKLSCESKTKSTVLSYIHINKKGVIESSDGYKVSTYKLSKKVTDKSFLLSLSAVNELVKYPIKKIAIKKNWVHFKTKLGTIFSCRLYSDEFPNIRKIIKFEGKKVFLPIELTTILDRAKIFSKSELQREEIIEISIKKKKIKIFAKTEIGWIKDAIKTILWNKKEISFQINPNHLIFVLTLLEDTFCFYHKNKIKFTNKKCTLIIPISTKSK
jgi:hypothetical protein